MGGCFESVRLFVQLGCAYISLWLLTRVLSLIAYYYTDGCLSQDVAMEKRKSYGLPADLHLLRGAHNTRTCSEPIAVAQLAQASGPISAEL